MKRRLLSRGSAMVTVTVAFGLVGALALILAQLFGQSLRSSRRVAALGEVEDLRNMMRQGIDCGRTLTGFATPSGFPPACHSGTGNLALLRQDGTVFVPAGGTNLGDYQVRVSCPGPGPAGCGCSGAGCARCGQRLKIEYSHSRRDEGGWKDLFGTNLSPCAALFGGGAGNVSCPDGEIIKSINFLSGSVTCEKALRAESGRERAFDCPAANYVGGLCNIPFTRDVVFATPFEDPPQVIVSAGKMSDQLGCVGNATDHTFAGAVNVTRFGFRMQCAGSPEITCGAYEGWYTISTCNWMAVGR